MKMNFKLILGAIISVVITGICYTSAKASNSKSDPKKIVLTKKNTLVLNDEINGAAVADVITKAKVLDNKTDIVFKTKDPIYLYIRSPGGEIQVGMEMLEDLKGLNRPVDTITMFGASMAFQTVQQLGKRYIVKNGILMSHRAHGGFEADLGGQKPSQMDSRKGLWESIMDEMDQETVNRSNGKQTLESYQKAYASELWVTGSQAVEQGYADSVVTVQCDESLSGVTTKTISFLGIGLEYDVDDCPLNSTPMNIRLKLSTNKGVKSAETFYAEGGEFGVSCLVAAGKDPSKLCAIDTTLTLEKLNQVKDQFRSHYENLKQRIVPYGF